MSRSVVFERWRTAVELQMQHTYVITLADAGISDDRLESFWKDDWSPYQFVDWFGDKYDLIPRSAFTL